MLNILVLVSVNWDFAGGRRFGYFANAVVCQALSSPGPLSGSNLVFIDNSNQQHLPCACVLADGLSITPEFLHRKCFLLLCLLGNTLHVPVEYPSCTCLISRIHQLWVDSKIQHSPQPRTCIECSLLISVCVLASYSRCTSCVAKNEWKYSSTCTVVHVPIPRRTIVATSRLAYSECDLCGICTTPTW